MSTTEVLTDPTLDDLAATANQANDRAQGLALEAVQQAIICGEALLAARSQCPGGKWTGWCKQNLDFAPETAAVYMRFARFKEIILDAEVASLNDAKKLLVGMPDANLRGPAHPYPESVKARARQLHQDGMSRAAIADMLGAPATAIYRWVTPGAIETERKKNREEAAKRRANLKALADAERAQKINRALVKEGQAFNEAYAIVTRLDGLLGQARGEAQDGEKRRAINEAHAFRDKMMDALIRVLGVS